MIWNPTGRDYRQWFQEYSLLEPNKLYKDSELLKAVNTDELDLDLIEQRVQQSTPTTPLTNGFCSKCQEMFDNWPTLGISPKMTHESKPADFPHGEGWETAVVRPCSTFELEGATRAGCRFCTFLLHSLTATGMLETFRKVEIRLDHLGEDATTSLSVQNWGKSPVQILWLNLPNKVCTHCNAGMAVEVKFHGSFLPEEGTRKLIGMITQSVHQFFTPTAFWNYETGIRITLLLSRKVVNNYIAIFLLRVLGIYRFR